MSGTINDTLIVDNNGIPIPQAIDMSSGKCVKMISSENALLVKDINTPSNGIYKIQLVDGQGNNVSATQLGLSVVLASNEMDNMAFNGESWVNYAPTQKINLFPKNSYSEAQSVSADIWNCGAKNGFLVVSIPSGTTNNKITAFKIDIKMNDTYVTQKVITTDIGEGNTVVSFGIDDDTNKFVIPAEFRIVAVHQNTTAFTYQVGLQLV